MWPYYTLVLLILLLQFKLVPNYYIEKEKINIAFLILFLFAALRGMSNGDYTAYLTLGADIDTISEIFTTNTRMEIGYSILCYIVNTLSLPHQFNIILMNLISLICIMSMIKEYSSNWCISALVYLQYFFQFDMHTTRGAVAIAITTLGIKYINDRKILKFLLIIFLAMLFHKTAIVTILLYFIFKKKIELSISLIIIVGEIFFSIAFDIDAIAIKILNFLNIQYFLVRYVGYMNSDAFGYSFSLLDPRLLIMILLLIISKILFKHATDIENFFINCNFVGIVIMIFFSNHTIIANRLSVYYRVYEIILVPMILNNIYERYKREDGINYLYKYRIMHYGTVMMYIAYSLAYIYLGYGSLGLNYKLFFQNPLAW